MKPLSLCLLTAGLSLTLCGKYLSGALFIFAAGVTARLCKVS